MLGRLSGTDEILGRGGLLLHSVPSWQRTGCRTLKMCLVPLRAETAKPNVAGAVSAKEVNSDPRAMREEENYSSDFAVRLIDLEAMKWVRPDFH